MFNHTTTAARLILTWMAVMVLTAVAPASGQTIARDNFTFVNAVDVTQGFSSFGSMPAINNAGAVAFQSVGAGFESGAVLRWQYGALTTIASSKDLVLRRLLEKEIINSAARVGFNAA